MPSNLLVYRCMVISPGDVLDARDAVEAVIDRWNAQVGPGLNARIDAVRWESHARPEMGGAPQAIINRQLVDHCDFGVALFWSRLGTPTAEHESGSVEEIYRLLGRGSRVLVYFCDAPIPQAALKDDQFERLQEVRRRFQNEGLLGTYSTTNDLRETVNLHITGLIAEMLLKDRVPGQPIPSSGTITAPTPDVRVTAHAMLVVKGDKLASSLLGITVENHSPVNVYLSGVSLEMADGTSLYPRINRSTGEHNAHRTIEPGNSFIFGIDPTEISEAAHGRKFVCAVAVDKVGRRFRSDPATFESELAKASLPAE